jgi:Fic family protein
MTWQPDAPYNQLPGVPPRGDVETRAVLKATVEARAALAALEQATRRIPNPTVLINAIPLLEAQASSEIENIVTTADELFRAAQDEGATMNPAAKETLRYRAALFLGLELVRARPVTSVTAIEICSAIKGREMGLRASSGTFIGNPATGVAVYTPPDGTRVIASLLGNWEEFVHGDHGLDPLVVMAVAHYQFEAIHPFDDGNGRAGRILNVLLLVEAQLLSRPVLYLSRYIIENKSDYYSLLLGVTKHGDWESWLLFMLEGVRQTALSTIAKIDSIHDLQEDVRSAIRRSTTAGPNSDLMDVLFEQPYSRISNVMQRCGVSRPTATAWLNALSEVGVLESVKTGRDRVFINTAFVDLLTRPERVEQQVVAEPSLF